ncbi:uncharacterized protein yhaC [Shigella dysenteriae 1617]|uniref:Uncharacterized protein n=3 Tax=Shigella dysenteriae TaxID=622 RepID=E2X7T5_SHIDY|nr:Hypothetical protein Asd1617_04424 [Shigella dysenteriae 1617]EFP72059.1 uncharacterized protein yhaC [Shigella dysenteriae 1617]SPZ67781.1 chaperone [Shigella dysenteriae]
MAVTAAKSVMAFRVLTMAVDLCRLTTRTMNVNAGHERTSKARIIHQIQLIRGITDIIIEDYENIKENAYLVIPQINYTMDLNIEDSSSEELLSDNTIEKDENSQGNGFEVGEYNTYEAYNSENQYFTREDYTYNYNLLNAI